MRGSGIAWLGHPVAVAAVIVLVINDQVLKGAYPGAVTGKVSDFAGLVFAPALLAVAASVFGRHGDRVALGAIVITGGGFALVKTTAAGAGLAGGIWGAVAGPSLVRVDPGDLLALPALGLSWAIYRRVRGRGASARWVRFGQVALVVPFAVFATVATSAVEEESIDHVGIIEGQLVALTPSPIVSSDGGASWRPVGERPSASRGSPTRTTTPTRSLDTSSLYSDAKTTACLPSEPRHCYRVVDGRVAVEETTDGRTWRIAWEISRGRTGFLQRQAEDNRRDDVVSRSLAVQELPGGHAVVVANGGDGLSARDVGGTWRRLGFPTWTDTSGWTPAPVEQWTVPALEDPSAYRFREIYAGLIVLALALLASLPAVSPLVWGSLLTVAGGLIGLMLPSLDLLGMAAAPFSTLLILVGVGGLFAAVSAFRAVPVALCALLSAVIAPLPIFAWTTGIVDDLGVAILLTGLVACGGIVETHFVSRRTLARFAVHRPSPRRGPEH